MKTYLDCYEATDQTTCNNRHNWAKCIWSVLKCLDFEGVWQNQGTTRPKKMCSIIREKLKYLYASSWFSFINNPDKSPKLRTYKLLRGFLRQTNICSVHFHMDLSFGVFVLTLDYVYNWKTIVVYSLKSFLGVRIHYQQPPAATRMCWARIFQYGYQSSMSNGGNWFPNS